VKVGYESDLALATQLENVLEMVKPDRAVLVSDGAEDEYIFPMVSSRVKVDSVKRVFVKQAPTVEGTFYIITKMMRDDKIRKRVLPPIGLVFLVLGLFAVVPKIMQYMQTPDIGLISEMGLGVIAVVIGLYLIFYAYRVGEHVSNGFVRAARAVRSGSLMIPFAVLSVILIIGGVTNAIDAARSAQTDDLTLEALLFLGALIWMWMFAVVSYTVGKLVSQYIHTNKVQWSYIVLTLSVFAIAFIGQGAIDATMYFLNFHHYNEIFIFLEILAGFLLAAFGGLLNLTLRRQAAGSSADVDTPEGLETPD